MLWRGLVCRGEGTQRSSGHSTGARGSLRLEGGDKENRGVSNQEHLAPGDLCSYGEVAVVGSFMSPARGLVA